MGVGDHQLHALQAAAHQAAQELGPEGLRLGGADARAEDLAAAVLVDAVAIMAATETMLPSWRTLR